MQLRSFLTILLSLFTTQNFRVNCNPIPRTRVYYIAAVEEEWNYLPETTRLDQQQSEYAEKYVKKTDGQPRIGNVYKKAMYREYTDSTYSERKTREPWLGILGPLLQGEVGDVLEIHLLNNASHPVSLHTHGAHYEKPHEGATYHDSTHDGAKVDPGQTFIYNWRLPRERGPTDSDPNCAIWAYHSHIHGDSDIVTGLIGPLIICKSGFLTSNDITSPKSYVLLFLIFDENQNWYLDENIESHTTNLTAEEIENLKENEDFMESNLMYSVNGLMYDSLPGLDICLGSSVTWHLIGMGNEADIHAVTFAGQPLLLYGHRTDIVHLIPGQFASATMKASRIGRWAIKSEVGNHFQAGMKTHFSVNNCPDEIHTTETPLFTARSRNYYIAAEEAMWNYAPTGMNVMNNISLVNDSEASEFFQRGSDRIGGEYKKALYKEYTDESFLVSKTTESHLGLLGPTLRAEVGEVLKVTFLNRASRPYNLQSTAFVCQNCTTNDSEAVLPGETKIYDFFITEELGPTRSDHQCISWRYFSNVDSVKDSYSGLNGFLLTCRPDTLNEDGSQKFVGKEHALMFAVMDENESHYLEDNIALMSTDSAHIDREDPDFMESNLMHSINGLMYGNLMGIDLCLYENVSFHLMSIGHEVDLHVANFRGNAFIHRGNFKDTLELLPGSHTTVTMRPDVSGKFLLQCQTNDHIKGGMQTYYSVRQCNGHSHSHLEESGTLREYFVAVIEEEWDYAPQMHHPVYGGNLTENEESKIFVTNDDTHIGSRYRKALFREYTDASFTHQKARSNHLGILGPMIKGEIGDTIRITFLNNASREYNMKPHGLIEVSNGTSYTTAVQPGDTEIYTWLIPQRAGPSSTGFECTNWIYYSAVDIVKDTNSGLVGPLVVCNPGILQDSGLRKDVNREFSVLFTVMDENESWYLDENIEAYCKQPSAVDKDDENFKESNLMHSMNGLLYSSLHGLEGKLGDKVAWYLMALGTEVDMHSAHFHGLTAVEKNDADLISGHREDVVELLPGVFKTVEMNLDAVGSWMFHCHVDDHLKAGMMAMVTVRP